MTLFEYMSVAISIVMSLALVRVVSGISHTVAVGRRYWVHLVWMAVLLLVIALHWWNLWAYRDFDDWNFLVFVSLIIAPALFCFQAAALVPDDPDDVLSWQEHFSSVRRRFFISLTLVFVTFMLTSWMLLDMPWNHVSRPFFIVFVGVGVIGAASANLRVQAVLAVFVLCLLVVAAFWFFFRPGDFPSFWEATQQLKRGGSSAIASLWQIARYAA